MASLQKLSDIAIGASATVREFSKAGASFIRLREMGVLPGTLVKLVRVAPLGDPIEIQVRGYSLTLRKSEADHILTEPVGGS